MVKPGWIVALGVAFLGVTFASPAPRAHACGGLFCNSAMPVNQAAERIVFVENGDGTVTSVIEIQYQGPSERFSWVLPVPGTPEVAVSSTTALDRLQFATNPQYTLQTSFAVCGPAFGGMLGASAGTGAGGGGGSSGNPGVVVLAQGTVGPFDYEVIALDPELPEPADVAINWLSDEGYEVTALAPEVLGPYLENGLNLLAFRLSKNNDAGSIRPIMLTYESELPYIPIRPTAVAANDDMGIMVWVLSDARAVPDNYKSLELNEALINWFSPSSNYNEVVSAAADEAGGQGFVTEFAGSGNTLDGVVVSDFEQQYWTTLSTNEYGNPADFLRDASSYFGQWDGYEDAVRSALTLPDDIAFADYLACPQCYADASGVAFDSTGFLRALYEDVYRPMLRTEELLQSRPYMTRLYTTMSADEMTMDPAFNFNPDLDDVSNFHTASQELECNQPGFKVTLSDGRVVYGAMSGIWPVSIGDMPATKKILQVSTSGQGQVVVDNSDEIAKVLARLRPAGADDAGAGGAGTGGRSGTGGRTGSSGAGGVGGDAGMSGGTDAGSGSSQPDPEVNDGDGCAAAGPLAARTRTGDVLVALLALGWIARRRRRV